MIRNVDGRVVLWMQDGAQHSTLVYRFFLEPVMPIERVVFQWFVEIEAMCRRDQVPIAHHGAATIVLAVILQTYSPRPLVVFGDLAADNSHLDFVIQRTVGIELLTARKRLTR